MRYRNIGRTIVGGLVMLTFFLRPQVVFSQESPLQFDFDRNAKSGDYQWIGEGISYSDGLEGEALMLIPERGYQYLSLRNISLTGTNDFSVQIWVKTTSQKPTVLLSQKSFYNKGITTQKNAGWALYSSGGTFGWCVGSGDRRSNYERDNGAKVPINDGKWHQVTMTYSQSRSEFRLYLDGQNKAIYKVNFTFASSEPLVIGAIENPMDTNGGYSEDIESGQTGLQAFVDEFSSLGLEPLRNEEFLDLLVDPNEVFELKLKKGGSPKLNKNSLSRVLEIRSELVSNPYTVYQNRALTLLKPVSKLYSLQDGKIVIDSAVATAFTEDEKLFPADFVLDNLTIWDRTISSAEVADNYQKHRKVDFSRPVNRLENLTVGVWNIWHGGIHWSYDKDGWDSRMRIVEMIKAKNIDVILMQETYSSGDFIAAELGYYFATTSDYDYRYQGANISVISRYPITEVQVSEETEFNNVAAKLAISETQEIWAISNWYGMRQFPVVFDFHQTRFENSDQIPILFGGDFNAIPHTDGGDSPASVKLIDAGFTDAFRSQYPDVDKYPGFTHRSGERIDQLYYKGSGLVNMSTEVIADWSGGFPSDHYLIISGFNLKY